MKKINYFKILADKTIKVIGFHGLNRFFYAYVSYDGKKILISNTETKNIPCICVYMPDNGIIHDIEFYHMLQSKMNFTYYMNLLNFMKYLFLQKKRLRKLMELFISKIKERGSRSFLMI